MSATTLVLIISLGVLGYLFLRHRRDGREKIPDKSPSTPYHSVSITTGPGACQTAKSLRSVRFLSAEAPLLPLISCDATRCNCTFAHHADRRRGNRRNPYSAESHGFSVHGGEERRERRGRRQTDGMQIAPGT